MGAIVALLARRSGGLSFRRRTLWLFALAAGASLALIMVRRHGLSTEDPLVDTIGYTLLACFFGALLTLVVTASAGSRLGGIFSSRGLRLMGRYSYGLYVLHHPILIVTSRSCLRPLTCR
jgi:peptidoglycan/LPS O-acetylase OafA/YrhL